MNGLIEVRRFVFEYEYNDEYEYEYDDVIKTSFLIKYMEEIFLCQSFWVLSFSPYFFHILARMKKVSNVPKTKNTLKTYF